MTGEDLMKMGACSGCGYDMVLCQCKKETGTPVVSEDYKKRRIEEE